MIPHDAEPKPTRARPAAFRPTSRSCSSCTACCHTLAIDELNKPALTPCAHQRSSPEGSCGIYTHRPGSCRDFQCLWLRGLIHTADAHRPDRSGLLLIPNEEHRAVEAVELTTGAAAFARNAALIDSLRAAGLAVLITDRTRTTARKLTPITLNQRPVVTVRPVSPAAPRRRHA